MKTKTTRNIIMGSVIGLIGIGWLITADWRIFVGVFLIMCGDNLARSK